MDLELSIITEFYFVKLVQQITVANVQMILVLLAIYLTSSIMIINAILIAIWLLDIMNLKIVIAHYHAKLALLQTALFVWMIAALNVMLCIICIIMVAAL